MSDKAKKIFLIICITVPFTLYCVYYYSIMIKNAPYKFVELENISIKTSVGGHLDKTFSSKTGDLQYINNQDSLVKQNVKLSKDDLLYLHRRAAELGFWNMPEDMIGDTSAKSPRYIVEYNYQRKTKVIKLDGAFNGDPKLKDAALELIKTIDKSINVAADRN